MNPQALCTLLTTLLNASSNALFRNNFIQQFRLLSTEYLIKMNDPVHDITGDHPLSNNIKVHPCMGGGPVLHKHKSLGRTHCRSHKLLGPLATVCDGLPRRLRPSQTPWPTASNCRKSVAILPCPTYSGVRPKEATNCGMGQLVQRYVALEL